MRGWCWLLLLSGCSFIFVEGPPPDHPQRTIVDCSTSNVAPVLDVLFAGYQMVRIGMAANATDADYEDAPIDRSADIGFGIGFFVLHTASAVYGFSTTSACKDAKAEAEMRLRAPREERSWPPGGQRACRGDVDCPPGYMCVQRGGMWLCAKAAQEFNPVRTCAADSDCPRGQLCGSDQVCRPR